VHGGGPVSAKTMNVTPLSVLVTTWHTSDESAKVTDE
jgi:hypothetical protein